MTYKEAFYQLIAKIEAIHDEPYNQDEEDDNEFFINCGKDLTCDRIEKIANDLVKQLLVGE
jgi:hypothetical protein